MASPGDYGSALQALALDAYRELGLGDESLAAALAERDADGVGSIKLVSMWRRGHRTMPLGALDVLLEHAGAGAVRVLDVVARRYGCRARPLSRPAHLRPVLDVADDLIVDASQAVREAIRSARDGVIDGAEAQRLQLHARRLSELADELAAMADTAAGRSV